MHKCRHSRAFAVHFIAIKRSDPALRSRCCSPGQGWGADASRLCSVAQGAPRLYCRYEGGWAYALPAEHWQREV